LISHHASEATLLAYAAGTLPETLALVAATHLGGCSVCRQSLATLQATGGAVLDGLAPVPLASDALKHVLSRLHEPAAPLPPILNPELPAPLDRVAMGRWWPVGNGMRWRPLHGGISAWGGLILVEPGKALPRHGHAGRELTCVLSGSFADGEGRYEQWDLSEPEVDHDDPPLVVGADPCLCVTASEGWRFRGLLGLAQRLIGQ
jgi:putative transcriptional regulator